jgi:uncharacterized protein HemX
MMRYFALQEDKPAEEVRPMERRDSTEQIAQMAPSGHLRQLSLLVGLIVILGGMAATWGVLQYRVDATAAESKRVEAAVQAVQSRQHSCELDLREVRTQTAVEIKGISQRLDGLERGMSELLKRSRRER